MKFFMTIFVVIICCSVSRGQEIQGYIDYEEVLRKWPKNLEGQKRIDLLQTQLEDSTKALQDYLLNSLSVICHTPQSIAKARDDAQQQFQSFQKYAKDTIAKAKEAFETNITSQFQQKLNIFCTMKNLYSIIAKKAILVAPESDDLTEEFIIYLQEDD